MAAPPKHFNDYNSYWKTINTPVFRAVREVRRKLRRAVSKG